MDFEEIKSNIRIGKFEISFHAEKERYAEEISLEAIKEAVLNGEVLEDYPADVRGASCLILGYGEAKALHIVCGYSAKGWTRIITVYIPRRPKWIDERTRAKNEKR